MKKYHFLFVFLCTKKRRNSSLSFNFFVHEFYLFFVNHFLNQNQHFLSCSGVLPSVSSPGIGQRVGAGVGVGVAPGVGPGVGADLGTGIGPGVVQA